jgi:hypothetical protein
MLNINVLVVLESSACSVESVWCYLDLRLVCFQAASSLCVHHLFELQEVKAQPECGRFQGMLDEDEPGESSTA